MSRKHLLAFPASSTAILAVGRVRTFGYGIAFVVLLALVGVLATISNNLFHFDVGGRSVPVATREAAPDSSPQATEAAAAETAAARLLSTRHRPIWEYDNYLFSCFYRTAQPFYHGSRKVPSLKWIVVMLASLFDLTVASERNDRRETAAIVFMDVETGESLRALLARSALLQHRALLVSGFLRIVKVHNVSARSFIWEVESDVVRGHDEHYENIFPNFFRERWASEIQNGANNWRFAAIRDFLALLRTHTGGDSALSHRRVVVADSTDVAFQRSPFSFQDAPGCWPLSLREPRLGEPTSAAVEEAHVVFTLEHHSKTFSNEHYNRRWISCYGDAAAPLPSKQRRGSWLARRPISCAGVTFGNALGVFRYSSRQVNEIAQEPLVECAVATVHAALDQATHNFILHHALAHGGGTACVRPPLELVRGPPSSLRPTANLGRTCSPASVLANDSTSQGNEGFTVHMAQHSEDACVFHGNFGKLRLGRDPHGDSAPAPRTAVLSKGGVAYAVVHQYTSDRHPAVMELMAGRYAPNLRE